MLHWFQTMLALYGYWVVFFVVFLNNLCFPIPGDSVLVGAGFLAEKGTLSLAGVIAAGTSACFLGGCGGYWIGSRFGRKFLKKNPWIPITPESEKRVEVFFHKFGPKFVLFARFIALLHPVTGLLTGMWRTPLRPFLAYNFAGALAYSTIYVLLGYFFGEKWEMFKSWIGPVAALVTLWMFLRTALKAFFAGSSSLRHRKGKERPRTP
jgi:membrane protein DedA with SNARE-associated domain